jgi:hypothetical protein
MVSPRGGQKRTWKHITLGRTSALVPENTGQRFYPGKVELIAFRLKGHNDFYVPLNNQLFIAPFMSLETVSSKNVNATESEANDYNTSLFTCRECGAWLRPSDDGYGSEHGWCGCKRDEE